MDYLEYSLWRSWLVCGVAGQQVLMTGCKTEEAAAALLRPADGIQGIANKGSRGSISHISVQLARFLHRAWLLLGSLRPPREATKPCGATVTQSRTSRLPPVH